jgi:hypothetical protein
MNTISPIAIVAISNVNTNPPAKKFDAEPES